MHAETAQSTLRAAGNTRCQAEIEAGSINVSKAHQVSLKNSICQYLALGIRVNIDGAV